MTSNKSSASEQSEKKSIGTEESSKTDAASTTNVKPKKTVNDYVELIETVARVEYSRLPNHLIDQSELVNIGAIAVHVLLTSNPDREYNITYLSTAMKWAIRNELRHRYKWYSFKSQKEQQSEGDGDEEKSRNKLREAVYETILSVDGLMEGENPHELKDDSYTPEESSELREMARIVRAAISKLPERERAIVEARFYHNKKMREIGEQFDISPSRISRIVQAGLDKIKRELERRGFSAADFNTD